MLGGRKDQNKFSSSRLHVSSANASKFAFSFTIRSVRKFTPTISWTIVIVIAIYCTEE